MVKTQSCVTVSLKAISKSINVCRVALGSFVVLVLCVFLTPSQAVAQSMSAMSSNQNVTVRTVQVEVNRAKSVQTKQGVTDVFVANPVIADIQSLQATGIFVYGKKPGMTSLFFTYEDGHSEEVVIEVTQNLSLLRRAVGRTFPQETIQIDSSPSGVVLRGKVTSSKVLSDAKTLAEQYVGKEDNVVNNLSLSSSNQVYLKVRVAEVSRTVLSKLSPGLNITNRINGGKFQFAALTGRNPLNNTLPIGTGAGTAALSIIRPPTTESFAGTLGLRFSDNVSDHSAFFDMLDQEGLGTMLAEPNLVALSGQKASFLVGGEFAFPVPQDNNNITIEFKKFGISLEFTPTVISPDLINLRVTPEVSELDDSRSTNINVGNGNVISVPAIKTRRADTSVELASGQSFAVAGLLSHTSSNTLSKFPGLSQIPVLGALFKSDQFKRNETELVIVVTPYLVKPSQPKDLRIPNKGIVYASAAESLIVNKLNKKVVPPGTLKKLTAGYKGRMHTAAGLHVD